MVTLHVSVWVEILEEEFDGNYKIVTLHVSVWVEMVKISMSLMSVSVTLHVSVWVEMSISTPTLTILIVTLHVSVWVEITYITKIDEVTHVTLHVSVWVEILKVSASDLVNTSRSTWACELKSLIGAEIIHCTGHAPRERVSWNVLLDECNLVKCRSRSTWACELKSSWWKSAKPPSVTLHVSVWVEMVRSTKPKISTVVTLHVSVWVEIWITSLRYMCSLSRSTWACELKFFQMGVRRSYLRHAPRERVSWNDFVLVQIVYKVRHAPRERVSWNACSILVVRCFDRHAPRERVSWNATADILENKCHSHAPRERVSWNLLCIYQILLSNKSRSTWACELKL